MLETKIIILNISFIFRTTSSEGGKGGLAGEVPSENLSLEATSHPEWELLPK